MVGGGTAPATNFTRHEVQRPRPPQVAVRSMPAAWAAARMLVAGGSASSRRASAPRGSVRIVSATAMPAHCNVGPIEDRHGGAGPRRRVGGAGAISGPPRRSLHLELHARGALALHGGARFEALQPLRADAGADE